MQHRQPGRLKSVLLVVLGVVLLLSLIAPQAVSHLPLSFLCLTLTPLFLFAALETTPYLSRPVAPRAPCAVSQVARPALFEFPLHPRPPKPPTQFAGVIACDAARRFTLESSVRGVLVPFTIVIAPLILPLLIATVCLYILNRLRLPRRKPKRKSRFGFYPVAAGNALQAIQAIVQPSARHTLALRFEDEDEDNSGDRTIPFEHLHRQTARIRRGEPIDRLTALLPAQPSMSAPPD